MSRNARIPMPRGRRIAVNSGLAVGAAAIAASISMGTAPAAHADVLGSDAVTDLIGAFDPQAVSAAAVPETQAISYLIEAFDPNSFSSTGVPTDALGLLGYGLDTYLLVPSGLDTALEPYVVDLVGTITGDPGPRLNRQRSVTWSRHSTRRRLPGVCPPHRQTSLAFWPSTWTRSCWSPAALMA